MYFSAALAGRVLPRIAGKGEQDEAHLFSGSSGRGGEKDRG